MGDSYANDNIGNRCGEGVVAVHPVLASGITLSGGTPAGSDQTQTVVAGQTYVITFPMDSGTWLLSVTGVTSTAANIEWVGVEGKDLVITIPFGYTTLYFECDTNNKSAYMRKIAP